MGMFFNMRTDMNLCAYGIYSLSIKNEQMKIKQLLAHGTNTFVYKAEYRGRSYILKELFPEGLSEQKVIKRDGAGAVLYRLSVIDKFKWQRMKLQFLSSVYRNQLLQRNTALNDCVSRNVGLFHTNGTLYALYENKSGKDWSCYVDENLEKLIIRCSKIADIVDKIHRSGWLVVDVKASNFVINATESGEHIQLVDFDSMLRLSSAKRKSKFYCSSETAPPELLEGRGKDVGVNSDVYSLAAMLFKKISGVSYNECKTLSLLMPFIENWSKERQSKFVSLFKIVLCPDITRRDLSAIEFSGKLLELLR